MNGIFEYYADVEPVSVEWLWYPYIPFGKLTFLQGDPGEGKSTFAVRLAALLSAGRNLPDSDASSQPLSVNLLAGKGTGKGRKQATAIDMLRKMLLEKDWQSKDILEQMSAEGIGKRTVMKAKQTLGITSYRKDGAWYWCLNGNASL